MARKDIKLNKLIEAFLKERSKSDGGFAPVGEKDTEQLSNIMHALLEAKYQKDPDGDLPINLYVIDRTVYEPMHYFPLPYSHKAKDMDDLFHILNLASGNAQMAADRVDQIVKTIQITRRQQALALRTTPEKILERMTAGEKLLPKPLYTKDDSAKVKAEDALYTRTQIGDDEVTAGHVGRLMRQGKIKFNQTKQAWELINA